MASLRYFASLPSNWGELTGMEVIELRMFGSLGIETCVYWTDDEMSRYGINDKRASEMGHLDQSSKGGIMEILSSFDKPRKILIHINNTNPILRNDSDERKLLERNGIEVSYDGMDIIL